MKPAVAILFVFIGCCSNVVFLELLVTAHPGAGNIITFAQFLFITVEGFVFATDFGRKSPIVPLGYYVKMVVLFFAVSVINNYALNFNIPMPLHMIFRAGSLAANLVLGMIILKRRYHMMKYISVVMISVGIATCTLVSATALSHKHEQDVDAAAAHGSLYNLVFWTIGICMLLFALFMAAYMGIYQEQIYAKFGKHPREALFYNHALPLVGFTLLIPDIWAHVLKFNESAPVHVPLIHSHIPVMWLFLLGNILTQYVCIRSVFILTTECDSLTVTLVVTLRKFISLLFSIFYFRNPFTAAHWLGTALVFLGTLLFSEVHYKVHNKLMSLTARTDHKEKPGAAAADKKKN